MPICPVTKKCEFIGPITIASFHVHGGTPPAPRGSVQPNTTAPISDRPRQGLYIEDVFVCGWIAASCRGSDIDDHLLLMLMMMRVSVTSVILILGIFCSPSSAQPGLYTASVVAIIVFRVWRSTCKQEVRLRNDPRQLVLSYMSPSCIVPSVAVFW